MLRGTVGTDEVGDENDIRLAPLRSKYVRTLMGLGTISEEIVDLHNCFSGTGGASDV